MTGISAGPAGFHRSHGWASALDVGFSANTKADKEAEVALLLP